MFKGHHDRRKVTDWAYEELRDAIVELRLAPGEPLRELTLAEGLGVSKTPVREALGRLEQEGLVETASFKGAVVSSYSSRDLQEIYELRELFEGVCALRAAQARKPEVVEALQANLEKSCQARDAKDAAALTALLDEFDAIIYRQPDNARIQALIENLLAHLRRIGKLTQGIPGRIEASVEEHAEVVGAIVAGDADTAERSIRAHIRSVMDDQLRALESSPEIFAPQALRGHRVSHAD